MYTYFTIPNKKNPIDALDTEVTATRRVHSAFCETELLRHFLRVVVDSGFLHLAVCDNNLIHAVEEDEFKERTKTFAALLNSNALDFYIKHYTTLKVDGFYKYTTNYLTPLPITWGDDADRDEIRDLISTITTALDTESKTDRFPEAYIGEYDGELDYITYEWQTRRYPVNAEVQSTVDDEFTVQAGRSDEIRDAAMHAANRDERKRRATYVREAVNGRNVKSGEEMTIPIPRSDEGVERLLESLRADETTVTEADLDELEELVNDVVYEMFGIRSEEQDVIEKYLEEFRVY